MIVPIIDDGGDPEFTKPTFDYKRAKFYNLKSWIQKEVLWYKAEEEKKRKESERARRIQLANEKKARKIEFIANLDAFLENNRHEVPLLDDVAYCFIAATITESEKHPVGFVLGDMLVRVPSATEPALRRETFPIEVHRFGGITHLKIQNHPDVYERIKRFLDGDMDGS